MSGEKVRPGTPLSPSATAWNDLIDLKNESKKDQHSQLRTPYTGHLPNESRIILVKNTAETQVGRHGVLKIGNPIITPTDNPVDFANIITFQGDQPTATDNEICITLEPVSSEAIGRAVISGPIQCTIDSTAANAGFMYAVPKAANSAKLTPVAAGPIRILWRESGVGDKKAIVLLGGDIIKPRLVIITGATVVGTSTNWQWLYSIAEAEVTITDGAYPSYSAVSGGWTGTAYNIAEDANAATGDTPTGSGITRNQMDEKFELAKLPSGWVGMAMPVRCKTNTTIPADPEDPDSEETTVSAYAYKYFLYRANPMPGGCE